MLTLEDVTLTRETFRLSADVSFDAGITALLGPSGAGKSTLLDLVAGFSTPDAGRVLWKGADITGLAPAKRPCAMLFQDNNLFPHLTVARNLALALTSGRPNPTQRDQVAAALREVDLDGFSDRKPGALSGGQQARVALARVLLQDRPLLLFDEPFAALGPALKSEMLDLVASKARSRDLQVVMVSHDPQDAVRIADQVSVVADGTVHPPQETSKLFSDPPPELRAYLGS